MALSTLKQILDSKQVNYDGMRLYPADQFSIYIGGNKECKMPQYAAFLKGDL